MQREAIPQAPTDDDLVPVFIARKNLPNVLASAIGPAQQLARVVVTFSSDGLVKVEQFRPGGQRDASYAPATIELALARQLPQALAECQEMALSAAAAGDLADPGRA